MDKKICLDSDVCVEILKGNYSTELLFDKFGSYQAFVTSMTVFELFLRETNLEEVKNFVSIFNIISFDDSSAIKASEIFKELKKKGKMIDINDIFIASVCIVNNCLLATFNKRHFENIKELKLA